MHQPIETPTAIKFVRLITGEDLISEVFTEDSEKFQKVYLINPLKIVYSFGKKSTLSISLYNWVIPEILEDNVFQIKINDILLMKEVSSDMEEYYQTTLEHLETYTHFKKNMMNDYPEDEDFEESEYSYIKEMIEEMKNGKRKMH
jgi:hypothetical protein